MCNNACSSFWPSTARRLGNHCPCALPDLGQLCAEAVLRELLGRCLELRRVYGTMIKGFCVINNDRVRSLHADCERVVLLFAERPYTEGLQLPKQPAAKRQRVDAFTLDLDLAKVQEAEAFDWTQAPLGESQLLSLDASQLPDPRDMGTARPALQEALQAPSLLEESGLLDEMFPGVDAPVVLTQRVPGALPEALNLPEVAEPDALGGALEVLRFEAGHGPASVAGSEAAEGSLAVEVRQRNQKRRRLRRVQPPPGHLFGFDVDTQVQDGGPEAGHVVMRFYLSLLLFCITLLDRKVGLATVPLASSLAELRERLIPNRMGLLQAIADPSSAPLAPAPAMVVSPAQLEAPTFSDVEPELPEIQPLLGNVGDQLRHEMLGAVFATPPQEAAFVAAAAQAADAAAEAQLELHTGAADGSDGSDGGHDVQTAQVGLLMRRYLTEHGSSFLDDMMPPRTTGRSTAARAFSSLLALATGGGLLLQQEEPYGPIYVSSC